MSQTHRLLTMAAIASFLLVKPLVAQPAAPTGRITGSVLAPVARHRPHAVVFVRTGPKPPAVVKTAQLDQRGLVFLPRVLPIQKGWTVEFLNSDPVAHTVFSLDGEKYDLGTWARGEKRRYTFTKTGVYRQLCRVHDDMIAFIVVLDTPWFAVTDKAGQFALQGLPPGSYTLGIWHEKLAAADLAVTVAAGVDSKLEIALKAR